MLIGEDHGNWDTYLDHIGLFFFFCACAGVSIIVWIFNWICWLNHCCCCDFLHNPVNKRIAWWMGFSFLLGILACCISAFVTVNRFGFALEGSWCAVDRIYYDSINGQLKKTEPRWEGVKNITYILYNFTNFSTSVSVDGFADKINAIKINENDNENYRKNKIKNSLLQLNKIYIDDKIDENKKYKTKIDTIINTNIHNMIKSDNFNIMKEKFLDEFHDYAKTLRACLKVLAMIYYCLLLIAVTFAGVSMMFFACLKRQGYLLTFMHVLWNIIRFFIFSFFLYGTAYGIGFLVIRDSIAYIMYIFENITDDNIKIIGDSKNFFDFCLNDNENNHNFKNKFNEYQSTFLDPLNDFFSNYLKNSLCPKERTAGVISLTLDECELLYKRAISIGGLFGLFDCGFLDIDLQHLYRALYDASVESRILSALSLCSSFFGAVAVYFFLLVLHHYNNE